MAFQNIFTDGVLVDLDIHKWTGQRSLQAEDLGIPKDKLPKTFKLGQKALVPDEVTKEFNHIDYLARKLLTDMSFPFAFGNARFVPKKRFEEFTDELKKLQERFSNAVDSLCANYDSHRLKVRPEYVKAAHAAYSRMSKFEQDFEEDRDEYINAFLARVDSFYPPVETIRKRFEINFVVFQMAMPDLSQAGIEDVVSDAAKADLIKSTYQSALYEKVQEYVDTVVEDLRGKATSVLSLVRDNIKDGKRISEATLNMIKKMVDDYGKMDVVGDGAFYEKICNFRKKYVDPYSAKQLRDNQGIQKDMLKELKNLVEVATSTSSISAVADAYRQKIQL